MIMSPRDQSGSETDNWRLSETAILDGQTEQW